MGRVPEAAQFRIDPMLPQRFVIKERRKDTVETFSLMLEPTDDCETVEAPLPGQFNMLYAFGVGEAPVSIGGVSGKELLHTIREVGVVTRAMSKLRRGDMVGVRGAFGTGWPLVEARGKDVLLIAGGIGMAALRSAALQLSGSRVAKTVSLLYGARTPDDILYEHEFAMWREGGINLLVTVDRGGGGWGGNVGVVTTLISRVPFEAGNCIIMICGPEIMMKFTVRELKRLGVPEASIFLSMERNMKCAVGFCGHCQFGPDFICKDGPVLRYDRLRDWLKIKEL